MSDPAWDPLRYRLASVLATLQDGEFVILSHAVAPEDQRYTEPKRVLFWTVKPKLLPTGFMVQFIGQGQGCLLGTCEGPVQVGGHLELTDEQDRRIRSLGWRGPGDPGHYVPYAPQYTVVDAPQTEAARLAQMTVDALEIQGARPDLRWELERSE